MRRALAGVVFVAAIVAIVAIKRPHTDLATAATSGDDIDAYTASCTGGAWDASCPIQHAAVVTQVLESLDELRDGGDPKAEDIALEALQLDEPEIQLSAAQMLVSSSRDDVMRAMVPLLVGPHPALQRAAAAALANSKSDEIQAIADRWKNGHATIAARPAQSPFANDRAAPAVAAQFTAYPKATRYSPGDSRQSIGWSTPDSIDKVVAFYARTKATKVDAATWRKPSTAATLGSPEDDPDVKEIQRLTEEYGKTHDPAIIRKIQDVQQRLKTRVKGTVAQASSTIYAHPIPPGDAGATFVGFIVEGDGGHPVRALAIYREESIKATVVEMVWDTQKYPAW